MNLPNIGKKKSFWSWATVTKTLRPFDPGTKKHRHKVALLLGHGKLVKVRHYKGPNGETRQTVEVEL